MTAHATILLGTTSSGKLRELRRLIEPLGIVCRSLADEPRAVTVEETGDTFAENAALKATGQARACGSWVLAEDSGLCVPALGNAPGVRSARFAGEHADDAANSALLLERLADSEGAIVATASGTCGGRIAESPAGAGGFGYDPLFVVHEYHRTFGEIVPAVKAVISHRARALRALLPSITRHRA